MADLHKRERAKPLQIDDYRDCEPESLVPASGRSAPAAEADSSLYRAHLIVASATDTSDGRAEVSLYHHPRFGDTTPVGRYRIEGVYPTKQEAVRAALRAGVHMVDRLRGAVDSASRGSSDRNEQSPGDHARKRPRRDLRR